MLKVPRATKNPLRIVKHALCIETRSGGAGAFAQHHAGAAGQALNTCELGNLEPNKQEVLEVRRCKFIRPFKTNGLENLSDKIIFNYSQVVIPHDNPELVLRIPTSPRPVA